MKCVEKNEYWMNEKLHDDLHFVPLI